MNNIEKELLKVISRQVTDNVPKLYIQDVVSGRVFEYGVNCHHRLVISEDGRALYFYNLQNSDDSEVGDYRFYYEEPEDKTDSDVYEWARMVEHLSISQLLAEERKRVVQEIKKEFEPSPKTTIIEGTPTPEAELVNRGFSVCKKRVYKVLDRIERGE